VKDVIGTVYLIHFVKPYKHAQHYVGWTKDAEVRESMHRGGNGSLLLNVVNKAGIAWEIVRTWANCSRARERKIKESRHIPRYCPVCQKLERERRNGGIEQGNTHKPID